MEPLFIDTFSVTDQQCDRFGRLKPSAILWFVQEIAARHCLLLGTDWDTLAEKNMFWAIIRHQVQVQQLPHKGQTIRIETWPMPTSRVAYPRCVVAVDQDGTELFRTVSLWVLMDLQSRSMILPGKSGVEVNGVLRGGELPMPRSLPAMELAQCQNRRVCFTDLDINGHMNNCRYLDWVYDLLPSAFHQTQQVHNITLGYLSEAREGDDLQLQYQAKEDGCLQLQIQRTDDGQCHPIFRAELEFDTCSVN